RGTRPRVTAGLVTSLEYGWSAWSHAESQLLGVVPPQSVGLVIGWNFFEDDRGQRSGPLFFDAQDRRGLTGGGAGWAYDPFTGAQGPHTFGFFGPLYLDLGTVSDRGTVLDIGILLRGALAWVWSR